MIRRGAFLALAAAAPSLVIAPARAQSAPIRLSAVPTATLIEPIYARECGAFARAGLDVELHVFNASPIANEAMSARALDVCVNDPLQLTNALNHGLPYQYLATSRRSRCASGWRGRARIRSARGSSSCRVPSMVPAIERGTIGAAMVSEPFVTFSANETRVLADPYDAVDRTFVLNAYYARRDWIAANPDPARRLAAALYETARWVEAHPADALQILAEYSKVDPARLADVRRARYATALDAAQIRPVIELGLKYHAIERAVAPSEMIAKL